MTCTMPWPGSPRSNRRMPGLARALRAARRAARRRRGKVLARCGRGRWRWRGRAWRRPGRVGQRQAARAPPRPAPGRRRGRAAGGGRCAAATSRRRGRRRHAGPRACRTGSWSSDHHRPTRSCEARRPGRQHSAQRRGVGVMVDLVITGRLRGHAAQHRPGRCGDRGRQGGGGGRARAPSRSRPGRRLIDARGKIVMPGGIDPHVHCNWLSPLPDGTPAYTTGPRWSAAPRCTAAPRP